MKKSNYFQQRNFLNALLAFAFAFFASQMAAQNWPGAPGGGGMGGGGQQMNIGHFYGKVVDENNKGVGYATVQLFKMQFDTVTKAMKEELLTGQITEDNGDFSLEKLPVMGEFNLKISFIGYAELSQKVSFGFKPGGPMPAGGFDKDLGNIKLINSSQTLAEVTVTAEAAQTTLALDKKVYRVDKDASAVGGNAQDALKNVPSLSVDLDGNVSLRNGAPQIFVDGRPTTLSLDQIPSDAIESVEVITNPSAKYDAGGGTAGIINIVLKKEKRLGYNGNVRAGVDARKGFNAGGDINARAEKTNMFVGLNFNRMQGKNSGKTFRQNLFGEPLTNTLQLVNGKQAGYFANGRAGLDWFMDNRNTITISGNYTRGHFEPNDLLNVTTDSLYATSIASHYLRTTDQDRNFRNLGTSVQFKHLFPKVGAEWTADANYNRVKFKGGSDYLTDYDTQPDFIELQRGEGRGQFMTFQTDFVNPITDKIKVEGGLRAAMRRNKNDNYQAHLDEAGVEVQDSSLADHYKFSDDVYAAYGQFSQQFTGWGYQVGLRAESSKYTGSLTDRDSSFTIGFPFSLFPSLYLTKKLNDLDNIQFAYTRRINRPNFFQTMPFTDYSDKETLRRGNPELEPEFQNALELSYQNVFKGGHNLLFSLYYKRNTNLISSQFESGTNLEGNTVPLITYGNSKSSQAYGAEMTLKNTLVKIIDLTTNVNLYQSQVDATNFAEGVKIDRFSWFLKENMQVKLPAGFSVQLSGEYRSKASFTPDSGNRMPWQPGPTNTAQGYTLSNWFIDAALRKEVLNKKGTITLNVNDIFKTRRNGTYTNSGLFILEQYRYRDPQIVRLNFSYRFGKMDASLFKRKNMRMNMQGADMMGG